MASACVRTQRDPWDAFAAASIRLFDRGGSSGSLSGYQKHSDASGLGGSGSRVDPVRALAGELGLSGTALRRSAVPPPNIQRAATRL